MNNAKSIENFAKRRYNKSKYKRRIYYGVQQALTTEQVSILLWLKAIDDFKGEGMKQPHSMKNMMLLKR